MDPFKNRPSKLQRKKPLILSQEELARIIANADKLDKEERQQVKANEEYKKRVEESKKLRALMAESERTEKIDTQNKSSIKDRDKEFERAQEEYKRESKLEAKKKRVLNQAYKKLFEQTDRVKEFREAKNLDKVMKERADQMATKSSQLDIFAKYDAEFLLGVLKDIDECNANEEADREKREQNKIKNAEVWKRQQAEVLQQKQEERSEVMKEGQLIKNEDERDIELAKKRAQQKSNYKKMLDDQMEEKRKLFEAKLRLEESEAAKASLYNQFKYEMRMETKQMIERKEKEKKTRKQIIFTNHLKDSSEKKKQERDSLRKAILEADKKAREETAIKRVEQEEMLKSYKEFFEKNKVEKEQQKLAAKLENYQDARKIADDIARQQAIEDEKSKDLGKQEKEIEHVQLHQIKQKKKERREEELESINDFMSHAKRIDEDEDAFQKYAELEIRNCKDRGVYPYAMRKIARYYAAKAHPDEVALAMKKQVFQDSKARLGFVL